MSYEIGFIVIVTTISATNLYLYCYFGKSATDSFKGMADCLYECQWQALPVNLQKYLILMIESAQKPIFYHGFGMAVLDLETFCKVWKLDIRTKENKILKTVMWIWFFAIFQLLRTVVTYYMMFKTITDDWIEHTS